MKLTPFEQETILNFNEGEDTVSLYTYNKKLQKRFNKLAAEHPNAVSHKDNGYGAVTYEFSKKPLVISFRAPLSEEKLQQYRERGKQYAMHSKTRT